MADLVDRQAAIDLYKRDYEGRYAIINAEQFEAMLTRVPSAQPEIIRCKDCKHRPAFRYDDDGDRYVEGPRYPETLKNGHTFMFEDGTCPCVNEWDSYFSYIPKDDWFCANGERREEE